MAALATGLLVAGCGGTARNSTESTHDAVTTTPAVSGTVSTSSPAGATQSPSATSSPAGSASSSEKSDDDELAWAPFGPGDPKFPTPGWDVYYYFLAHDCNALQNNVQTPDDGFGNLYEAAVAVCLAAVDGQQDQWKVASEAFADRAGGAAIGPADCVDKTIATMTSTLLKWHDANPAGKPRLTFPRTADGRTACSRDNNSVVIGDEGSETTSTTTTTEDTTTTTSSTEATSTTSPTSTPSTSTASPPS
jgi:hypothetical protein